MRVIRSRPIPRVDFPSPSSTPLPATGRHPVTWTSSLCRPPLLDAALATSRRTDRRSPPSSLMFLAGIYMQQKLRPWVAAPLAGDGRGSGNASHRLQLRVMLAADARR